jgi:hypothetical protein
MFYNMTKQAEDIKSIREMMEKSSKFQSINGLSLVYTGVFAIAGAAFAHYYLLGEKTQVFNNMHEIAILLFAALTLLVISIATVVFFIWQKAKNRRQPLFSQLTWRTLYNLLIPLVVGGILSLSYLFRGELQAVFSFTLIFYGLALVNVSKFTFSEIHYLGLCELALGLLAALVATCGILWWTLGFGLLHIVFGLWMYFKYERKHEK